MQSQKQLHVSRYVGNFKIIAMGQLWEKWNKSFLKLNFLIKKPTRGASFKRKFKEVLCITVYTYHVL